MSHGSLRRNASSPSFLPGTSSYDDDDDEAAKTKRYHVHLGQLRPSSMTGDSMRFSVKQGRAKRSNSHQAAARGRSRSPPQAALAQHAARLTSAFQFKILQTAIWPVSKSIRHLLGRAKPPRPSRRFGASRRPGSHAVTTIVHS